MSGELDSPNTEFTYAEVGATASAPLPTGYHHLHAHRVLGRGLPLFRRAGAQVCDWQIQRRVGMRVEVAGPAVPDRLVRLGLGPFGFGPSVRCRVVCVVDTEHEIGFAYGTLPGHPESGEERFCVEINDAEVVTLRIAAFSRPGGLLTRVGAPVARLAQRRITERYLSVL